MTFERMLILESNTSTVLFKIVDGKIFVSIFLEWKWF